MEILLPFMRHPDSPGGVRLAVSAYPEYADVVSVAFKSFGNMCAAMPARMQQTIPGLLQMFFDDDGWTNRRMASKNRIRLVESTAVILQSVPGTEQRLIVQRLVQVFANQLGAILQSQNQQAISLVIEVLTYAGCLIREIQPQPDSAHPTVDTFAQELDPGNFVQLLQTLEEAINVLWPYAAEALVRFEHEETVHQAVCQFIEANVDVFRRDLRSALASTLPVDSRLSSSGLEEAQLAAKYSANFTRTVADWVERGNFAEWLDLAASLLIVFGPRAALTDHLSALAGNSINNAGIPESTRVAIAKSIASDLEALIRRTLAAMVSKLGDGSRQQQLQTGDVDARWIGQNSGLIAGISTAMDNNPDTAVAVHGFIEQVLKNCPKILREGAVETRVQLVALALAGTRQQEQQGMNAAMQVWLCLISGMGEDMDNWKRIALMVGKEVVCSVIQSILGGFNQGSTAAEVIFRMLLQHPTSARDWLREGIRRSTANAPGALQRTQVQSQLRQLETRLMQTRSLGTFRDILRAIAALLQ